MKNAMNLFIGSEEKQVKNKAENKRYIHNNILINSLFFIDISKINIKWG